MRIKIKRPVFVDAVLRPAGAYVDLKRRRAMDLVSTGAAVEVDAVRADAGSSPARSTKKERENNGSIIGENQVEERESSAEES